MSFAGFLVGVLVLELTLRESDASLYTQVRHVELARLDDLASYTLAAAIATAAFLVIGGARRRGTAMWLTLAGLALLVTVLVVTLTVNLPINTVRPAWDVQAPPADWASMRDRWQIAHAARTGAAVLGFGSLSAAAMVGLGAARRLVTNCD